MKANLTLIASYVIPCLAFCLSQSARAETVPVPAGLSPGDTYRLIFVTSSGTDAISTNIADYDNFVNAAANAAGSILAPLDQTWLDVGSTATVNAVDHIGDLSDPIYNVDGTLVANNEAGLWSGSLLAPILDNEFGAPNATPWTWTGTNTDGSAAANPLGAIYGLSEIGESTAADTNWSSWGPCCYTEPYDFYGISGELTVPAATPEPGTFNVMLLGALALAGANRYRRNRRLITPVSAQTEGQSSFRRLEER